MKVPSIQTIPLAELPAVLQNLPEHSKQQLNDSLLNDQCSSNEEMVEFWVTECGIPEDAAKAAIGYRKRIMTTMFLHLFEPVF